MKRRSSHNSAEPSAELAPTDLAHVRGARHHDYEMEWDGGNEAKPSKKNEKHPSRITMPDAPSP